MHNKGKGTFPFHNQQVPHMQHGVGKQLINLENITASEQIDQVCRITVHARREAMNLFIFFYYVTIRPSYIKARRGPARYYLHNPAYSIP
jgi:hypothetical protein